MILRRPVTVSHTPPAPRPTSATDPLAPTVQEWRDEARAQDARRRGWAIRLAVLLTLPLLAGGLYAFPLLYAWRWLCTRWPRLRLAGIALALPALVAFRQWPLAIFGPTLQLGSLLRWGLEAPPVWTLVLPWWPAVALARPITLPPAVSLHLDQVPVTITNPAPPLVDVLLTAWPTGLLLAAVLASAWGVGGFWEGPRLRSRTVSDVLRQANKLRQKGGDVAIVSGIVLRGYIGMLYAPEGGGKTEWLLAMIAASVLGLLFCGLKTRKAKWYLLTEQTDTTLEPYLKRWGLDTAAASGLVRIVTQEDAEKLWRAHGYETRPSWEHFGPIALDDAGRWGADVFVIDTWTFWVGSGAGATMIDEALAPLKASMRERGFAQLILAHTNVNGDLLGNKEFRRLCDLAIRMALPHGKNHPLRVFFYDKDRSNTKPGPHFGCVRDLTTDPPSFQLVDVTPDELEACAAGAKLGGKPTKRSATQRAAKPTSSAHQQPDAAPPDNVIDLTSVRPRASTGTGGVGGGSQGELSTRPDGRTDATTEGDPLLEALRAAGATGLSTTELGVQTGLPRQRVNERLRKLAKLQTAAKTGKQGKADVWRMVDREKMMGKTEDVA